jgi:diguanylate cyclase (GGDEF)-like protein
MGLNKKSVDDINAKGKRVLVRCDFNVPLKNGEITDDTRIVAALPTIKKLINDGGKVILCSHLGKVKNGPNEGESLAPVAKRLSEDLNFAANHDPLTRLYNRRYLVNQVNEWICKPEKSFWIVLMDVDEFKAVNDTYGHGYGDDVLREAGRLMLEEMMGKGIAARFGGEEFMLVFEQDDREQVLHSFRNIQEGLRRYSQNTRQMDITISGGMERYEADKQLDLLFTSVDRKLYIAKNNGKNRIVE